MSAIFGIINKNDKPVLPTELERMNAALAHHGTDGGGLWRRGSAGLGQRLMAFTPEDRYERQPLIGGDGRFVLISAGRVDGREKLITELDLGRESSQARPPAELPDGELLLRAYERWGSGCLNRLVGTFAFAVWDAIKHELFIARSPIIAPTLYYHAGPRGLAFSTMPKGLFALPFIPRKINEQKLADMLVRSPADPQSTQYHGISRLPTGSCLIAGREGISVRPFWQPDLKRELRFKRSEEYVEAFNELHDRVVNDQLRSITPVGIMMSGGLDSTAVAATAARILKTRGERLAVFTEVPRPGFTGSLPAGKYADETPFVQAVARMHDNMDLNLMRTDGRTFLDDLGPLFFHLERYFSNTANRAWIEAIYKEAGRQGARVLLDGGQGNMTFSRGGEGLLPELLKAGKLPQAITQARLIARRGGARSALRALVGQGLVPFLPSPLWRLLARLRGNKLALSPHPWSNWSPINPEFAAAHRVEERARDWGHDFLFRPAPNYKEQIYKALILQDLGVFRTPYRAMYGVDTRTPPADVRIAEFCLAIPEEQFLYKGESRSLIRRAMAGRLPPEIILNKKRGRQAADGFERLTGLRAALPAELDRLEQCGLVRRALDLPRLRRMVDKWPCDGTEKREIPSYFQYVLESGLMVGKFLQWFETGE